MIFKNDTEINHKKNEGLNVEQVAKYLPYWPLFLTFLILSMGGAYLYLRYAKQKYEATATILIKDEKKGYDDSKLMESLDMIKTKKILENEIEVLQSRTLMNLVVKKLSLYAPIFQEGKVKSVSAYRLSPLIIQIMNPEKIQAVAKINLDYDEKKGTVVINNVPQGTINQWLQTPYGTMRFKYNPKYKRSVQKKPFYFSILPVNSVVNSILSDLKVSTSSKLSSVINVSYRDENSERAEDILNELIISYRNGSLNEKNALAKNTLAFIEDRLKIVSKQLDSIEMKLQQFKSGRGAVDISKQGQLYLENISANDKQLSDLNMQLSVMDQLEAAATSPGSTGMLPSTLGVNDPTLTQQINTLSALQMQYDKLKLTVAENNPVILQVAEQIAKIKPNILANIKSQRQRLEKSRNNLIASGNAFTGILSSIPQKEKQLIEISRDQSIMNGIYSFLLQKREESELSFASTFADSKVVNYAQSSEFPVSPNRILVFLVALAFALGFPLALILFKETFNPRILHRKEIESLTKIPILGEIAFNKSKEGLVVAAGKRSVIAEEFRKIRFSLKYLEINKDHKKILVTSSISGEGKSFIAANLASSIALSGKNVVIVDLDLHNPSLGKFFGLNENQGVSEYLMGLKNLEEIIYTIPGNTSLSYISSGALQHDSSNLLENPRIKTLIEFLEAEFDVVIIDAAPVGLITDAYILSSICDLTLYVIRHKYTPKILVKRMDESLEVAPLKNPAIIFNGVKTRGFFKSNYGYGYNNYVYNYENKKPKKSVVTSTRG